MKGMTMKSALCAAAAIVIAEGAAAAFAEEPRRGRDVSGRVEGERGGADVRAGVERARGMRTRDVTVTGDNGRVNTLNAEQRRGRTDTGAFSSSTRARTFGDGSSNSRQRAREWNRDTQTATQSTTRTFRDGSSRSADTTATRTEPGEWTVGRTAVGRDGVTRQQSGTVSVDQTGAGRSVTGAFDTERGAVGYQADVARGDNSRSRTAVVTGPNGNSRTTDQTATFDPETGVFNRSGVRTFGDGSTASRSVTASGDDGVRTRTVETIGRDGSTRTVERTIADQGEGAFTVDRIVTGPDGETRTQTGDFVVTPRED